VRDEVLSESAIPQLAKMACEPFAYELSVRRTVVWAISNCCRGKPPPPWELVAPALPALAASSQTSDAELLGNTMWALSYLSDGTNDQIEAVLQAGVLHAVVRALSHESHDHVQPAALRVVGNLVTGSTDLRAIT
jgi:importin subunit alpha-1